jgi:hypothetical protein
VGTVNLFNMPRNASPPLTAWGSLKSANPLIYPESPPLNVNLPKYENPLTYL